MPTEKKKLDSRRKVWTHPKFKAEFGGEYSFKSVERNGESVMERTFLLVSKTGKSVVKSFESAEAAKKAGWKSADRK